MKNHQGSTPRKNHPATTPKSEVPRSPPHGKPRQKGVRDATSAFDLLLTTDEAFYRIQSRQLARRAADLGVPPSDLDDVVAEVWLAAVAYRHRFADAEAVGRLRCWLQKVVRNKAVDLLRHLVQPPCESLGTGEAEPIDEAEVRRAERAEQGERLNVVLGKVRSGDEDRLHLVRAHFCHGCSLQELAQQSGIKLCAVDGRIRRFLTKLRDLAEREPSCPP